MESKLELYAWISINFPLWLKHGATPLWLCFHDQSWGTSRAIQSAIEPWLESEGIFTSLENNGFNISIKVPAGEDFDYVVRDIVGQIKIVADKLNELPPAQETTI
jgi:hypothetical protein